MQKPVVVLARYESFAGSFRKAIEHVNGFDTLKPGMGVLIKLNPVGWDPVYPIAPHGVYTTSRLVEDMVVLRLQGQTL